MGICNTTIDFSLLFTLKAIGLPVIPANILSTFAAFCFSFFANKKYTFKSTGGNIKRELLLFIVVTLFGLWVIQTIVIYLVSQLLAGTQLTDGAILLVAKIIATIASLIWNYTLYSRLVFKQKEDA